MPYFCNVRLVIAYFSLFVVVLRLFAGTFFTIHFSLNQSYYYQTNCKERTKKITTCYGKCFLSKQLEKITDNSQEKPFPNNSLLKILSFLITIIPNLFHSFDNYAILLSNLNPWNNESINTSNFRLKIFNPPEIL